MPTTHQKRSQRNAQQNQQAVNEVLVDKTPSEGMMTATTLQVRKRTSLLVGTQRKSKRVKQFHFPTITPSPGILLGPPDAKIAISNNDISLDLSLLHREQEMKSMQNVKLDLKNGHPYENDDASDHDDDDTVESSNISSRTRSSSAEQLSCSSSTLLDSTRANPTSLEGKHCSPCNKSISLPHNVRSLICPYLTTGKVNCACAFRGNDNVPSCHDESFWFHYGHNYFQSLQEKELHITHHDDDVPSWSSEEEYESSFKLKSTMSMNNLRRSPRLHPGLSTREEIGGGKHAHDPTLHDTRTSSACQTNHASIGSSPICDTSDAQARYTYHMDYIQRNLRSYISLKDRSSVIDWLIDVSNDFKIPSETLSIAVGLLDRSLAVCTFVKNYKSMEKKKEECPNSFVLCPIVMQLLGCSCMLIATKLNEVNPLTVNDFCFLTENVYSTKQMIEMESEICKVLRFNLHIITPKLFCNVLIRASHASNGSAPCSVSYNDLTAYMVDYLLEISMLQYDLLKEPPSKVAVAILCLARGTLGQSMYSTSLEYYSGYPLCELHEIIYVLNAAHIMASRQCNDLKAVFNKYCSSGYGCVALKKALDCDKVDVLLGLR